MYLFLDSNPLSDGFADRRADLFVIRNADRDHRFFSGGGLRATFTLPSDLEVQSFGLAGFRITPTEIDANTIYLLDKRHRLWRAELETTVNGTPRPRLERIAGNFTLLQSDGDEFVFAVDNGGQLITLDSEGAIGLPLALGLNRGEKALRINGSVRTVLKIFTNQMRILDVKLTSRDYALRAEGSLQISAVYSLRINHELPEDLGLHHRTEGWDMRKMQQTGDCWLLSTAEKILWLKPRKETGQKNWIPYFFETTDLQILGIDATSIYLKAGADYLALRRVGPSPAAISREILSPEYFSRKLVAQGIILDLTKLPLFMQPSRAQRGQQSKRNDLRVREFKIDQKDPDTVPWAVFFGTTGNGKTRFFDEFLKNVHPGPQIIEQPFGDISAAYSSISRILGLDVPPHKIVPLTPEEMEEFMRPAPGWGFGKECEEAFLPDRDFHEFIIPGHHAPKSTKE